MNFNADIELCSHNHRANCRYCWLMEGVRGWGCRFLHTEYPLFRLSQNGEIETIELTPSIKARIFAKVFIEAEDKGVVNCPHFSAKRLKNTIKRLM